MRPPSRSFEHHWEKSAGKEVASLLVQWSQALGLGVDEVTASAEELGLQAKLGTDSCIASVSLGTAFKPDGLRPRWDMSETLLHSAQAWEDPWSCAA
jgi:hypothetical protein